MPPVRTNKRSTSPAEPSPSPNPYATTYTYGTTPSSVSVVQLDSYQFPTGDPDTDTSLPKKKRSHGKARPPGHIPRPPNAFIIFRTDYIKSMSTHSTPEMSKNLGALWKTMTASEKRPWVEKAEDAKLEHKKQYPDYKYKPVHPRDAEGRCIRKPRKPNQPRMKNAADDVLEHLPVSFQWMEKNEPEFPSTSFPSDASSISSPPRSPSPAPSAFFAQPQPLYQSYRRSSSVPLPGIDDRFFLGMAPEPIGYPPSPSGPHTGHVSRRLSKRPSTSMDFACAGIHPEQYGANSGMYLSAGDSSQWRLGHRRSISAPGYGLGEDISMGRFTQPSGHNFAPQANPLTPINPVFGNVFDNFSWDTPANSYHAPPSYENTMPPNITLSIPLMTHSPTSNISSATSPPASTPGGMSPARTPAIHHPAPMALFDFSAVQEQINEFDATATPQDGVFGQMVRDGFDNALGLAPGPEPYANQPAHQGQLYPGDAAHAPGSDYPVEAVHGHGGENVEPYPDEAPRPACNVGTSFVPDADLRGYEEGVRYTQPVINPPHALDFNELIVESY